jgi:hypothetical protein
MGEVVVVDFRRKKPQDPNYCACGCGEKHDYEVLGIGKSGSWYFCRSEPGAKANKHLIEFLKENPSQFPLLLMEKEFGGWKVSDS